VNGVEAVREAALPFAPERVAARCGIAAETIRELARTLAATGRAAVYGRLGTCTQRFGSLSSWLVDVLNALTGHLDVPGGAMFPKAAAFAANTMGSPGVGKGVARSAHRNVVVERREHHGVLVVPVDRCVDRLVRAVGALGFRRRHGPASVTPASPRLLAAAPPGPVSRGNDPPNRGPP